LLGFTRVLRYERGKADWIVRAMPTEPRLALAERLRALPYFVNNLWPWIRDGWIRLSGRVCVRSMSLAGPAMVGPFDAVPQGGTGEPAPRAVVLDAHRVVLGAIEEAGDVSAVAADAMNPAPQTIRPDMTPKLAAKLLATRSYLLITDANGVYAGLYDRGVNQRTRA
jgi:hypothetical protein